MKSLAYAVLAVTTLALAQTPADAADPARLVSAVRALHAGAYAEGPEAMLQARADLEALSKAEPSSAALHVWVATAAWRLVPRLKDPKQAERFCKDGIEHSAQALRLDPKNAEALAIKAALQGLSLRFDPGSMMTVGPELEANMGRALQMAPTNPRVHLLDGVNTLHKPAFVGGGAERALPKFRKALELFESAAPADSTAPSWGLEDALIWAGRSASELKDVGAARGYYERALALDPANGWVRHSLLPGLAKADSTTAEKSGS